MSVDRFRRLAGVLIAVLMATLVPVALFAQQATQGEPQSQFVPADTLPQEVLPATPLVFAAYAFVWLALVAYVFMIWRRLTRVERELQDVHARLASRKP